MYTMRASSTPNKREVPPRTSFAANSASCLLFFNADVMCNKALKTLYLNVSTDPCASSTDWSTIQKG
ncbi:hypothetical protein T4B_5146 [Trichinella pseudospiralis]|uniref:Uncharacterized protein n=2 Tax=Trichinella pseudospiralis TaxID=6337 RepID=A0A0V1JZZ5_TRIPS|nr:hypothetical protein T4E_9242 [Trichinella pseudospiralis]KRY92223.1 hypothetical protein T4D_6644 [Trichinella pseudospiralis]KRZ34337.1 hypothetical protein T4B_5146 [Trichinella pseudospiralis]KRZ40543.1 hypothetical protein T4C_10249 [Trichinella pseudospiralis]